MTTNNPILETVGEGRLVYRPKRAAQALDMSEATFWRTVARGDIKTIKIGARAVAVTAAEMRRFLTAGGA